MNSLSSELIFRGILLSVSLCPVDSVFWSGRLPLKIGWNGFFLSGITDDIAKYGGGESLEPWKKYDIAK